ncbi:MAG: VOC family protein [Cytophagales bacterium]|nr:VOC family protein [Cytophagales bacterium]
MNDNKISPCLWFHAEGGKISSILEYYSTVFGQDFVSGPIIPLGETPSGKTEMCDILLFGKRFMLMATSIEHHPLNDAVSWMIQCEDQAEIDTIWDYFTKEGKESQCGWCIDKYGLRWQVIPKNLSELMRRPDAFSIMMGQTKIIIADYLK